jgi:hypothetical protein
MTKRMVLALFAAMNLLGIASNVWAIPDPFTTLRVVPVGFVETGEPIVTQSPADLMIYVTDAAKQPLTHVWLLLAINEDTYTYMTKIYTNTSLFFYPADFVNVTETGETKIPPTDPYPSTPTWPGYPGCEQDEQYQVDAIKSKIGVPTDGNLYYALGDLGGSTGDPIGPVTTTPQFFRVIVEGAIPDMKVLVMALGYWPDAPNATPYLLNVHSPFTGSTLIVSEIGTMLLVLAPFSAFGLYKIRRRAARNKGT